MCKSILLFAIVLSVGPASAASLHNAIAVSSNGGWGYGKSYPSKAAAFNRALKECSDRGTDCKVVGWSKNACVALAMTPQKGYGTGWGSTRGTAQSKALQTCSSYGNADCELTITICND